MNTIKIECESCGGTGLYCGMCEREGLAVVCCNCNGTGCVDFRYKPFVQRKPKRGVSIVQQSRGTFILTGVGPVGNSISYAEFSSGKMPK